MALERPHRDIFRRRVAYEKIPTDPVVDKISLENRSRGEGEGIILRVIYLLRGGNLACDLGRPAG